MNPVRGLARDKVASPEDLGGATSNGMKDWNNTGDKLEKKFIFPNFKEALSFVNKVGELAEQLGHHPDILITNYKEVVISTKTHDEGNKVTEKDLELSKAIDKLTR